MRCCKGCEKILYLTPAVEKSYRGEAAFVLYKYIRAGKYQSSTNETADYYLKISNNCGFYLAQEEWKVNNESRIIPQIMRQKLPQWDDAIQIQRINMPKYSKRRSRKAGRDGLQSLI